MNEGMRNEDLFFEVICLNVILGHKTIIINLNFKGGHRICQIFNTNKIPKFINFTPEKRENRVISGQQLRMEDVLLIYLEQLSVFVPLSS